MNKKKKLLLSVLVALMTVFLVPITASAAVKSVQITSPTKKSTYTVWRNTSNSSKQLKVKVSVTNGSSKKVKYKSSSPKVVYVTSKGKMIFRKAGKATITVTSNANSRKKDTLKVTVKQYVTKVTASISGVNKSGSTNWVYVGAKPTVKYKLYPTSTTYKTVSYKSSNTAVATISSKGTVTTKKAGTVTFTVTSKDSKKKSDTVKLTVRNPIQVSGMTLSANAIALSENAARNIAGFVKVTPSGAQYTVAYKSADTSIATVSTSGTVKGISKGSTTVTVTVKDKNSSKTFSGNLRVDVSRNGDYTRIAQTAAVSRVMTDVTVTIPANNLVAQINEVLKKTTLVNPDTTLFSVNAEQVAGRNLVYTVRVNANKELQILRDGVDITSNFSKGYTNKHFAKVTVGMGMEGGRKLLLMLGSIDGQVTTDFGFTLNYKLEGADTTFTVSNLSVNNAGYSTASLSINGGAPTAYRFFVENNAICVCGDVTSNPLIMKLVGTGNFSALYYN